MGTKNCGWYIDYAKMYTYLHEHYGVSDAYIFIGYIPKNTALYTTLQKAGFILIFKPVIHAGKGNIKGNCDGDLIVWAMKMIPTYTKAVILTSDGDFYSLVDYLVSVGKLLTVVATLPHTTSKLLKSSAGSQISFLIDIRTRIEKSIDI